MAPEMVDHSLLKRDPILLLKIDIYIMSISCLEFLTGVNLCTNNRTPVDNVIEDVIQEEDLKRVAYIFKAGLALDPEE